VSRGHASKGGRYPSINSDGANSCVICFAAPRDCVLLWCGHIGICQSCAGQMRRCPLCRQNIVKVQPIFNA